VEAGDSLALRREYAYYDPIYTLPADGQQWWRARSRDGAVAPARDAAPAGLTLAQP
jgi:lysine 2,3-aminomutase